MNQSNPKLSLNPVYGNAIIFRSIALFTVLFQLRLLAGDLADTEVFTAALLAGFAAAVFLTVYKSSGKTVNPVSALISIFLIPWFARALIAMPRLFIPGSSDKPAIALDSLLLNLDRNNFVSLLPFYWIAVTSWFSMHSRKLLRASVIADAAILLVIFSIARTSNIELYRWPIVMIILFAGVVFLQALALLFSMPPETKLRVNEICFAITALLVIIALGGFLFLKPLQEQAVEMGGGLLKPKLFSFDFSQFLKLESEISMKNDLILIVKKDDENNILLRRSVLSGYGRKQGFFKIEELDEQTHPQRLPDRRITLQPKEFEAAKTVNQEYFIVNFDSAAFIGMKEPVTITPYENWDASSFNSAYAVQSTASSANYWNLSRAASGVQPGAEEFGLSENEYKIYTEYGNDERLLALAEEITKDARRYNDKVVAVYRYLKNGDYRYSLKPGIAPDGDQLGWFLFNSKKGYCSYYAFAMTLLLRSLGIPARVAAGFFVDPDTNTFDYYPVRSDMAHAWVEVAFPRYGWIEYDPTTENLAEGEEFQFSSGVDPMLFEKLMREILENRSGIKIKEGKDETSTGSNLSLLTHNTINILCNYWHYMLAALLAVLFLYIRCGLYLSVFLTRDPRKKSIRLFKHTCRLLRFAGLRRRFSLTESEWTLQLEPQYEGVYLMYQDAAAARFAPEYSASDYNQQLENYKKFSDSYRRNVPLLRRISGWLFPPLALAPGKNNGKFLILLFVCLFAGSQVEAQSDLRSGEADHWDADTLFDEASESEYAELWERAIELYRMGVERFPDDARFPWALGNLYYYRSLFGLAWDEFIKSDAISPDNPVILLRLARTAGYLNRDTLSVEYYERVLELEPDNKEAIGSLGWMYFKVHRLADGEWLLVSALDRFGDDADFAMTLGTVYSDMYRYDESKYWYNKAITMGDQAGDRVFTAVAWYNLSILESRYYRYDLCMDATNSSLNAQNRASGRLARGELYMRQLELEKSQKDYQAAYETDTSPLAKLNLAQVYQVSGRLEEARLYAEDCLKGSDHSWMLNFGIDPDRYKRDIHEILYKTYSGLAETERFLPTASPNEKIRSLAKTISYKFRHAVNLKLYRKYCLAAANAYGGEVFEGGGPHLNSLFQYFNAFEDYPRRAIVYLNKAREFETSLIPASEPSYDLEEGILLGRENLINRALDGFDPVWERELISHCHRELANRKNPQAAEELFALNRGALRQAGITLPVRINLNLCEKASKSKKNLVKALAAAGFTESAASRFVLEITINGEPSGYSTSCVLTDTAREIKTLQYSHSFGTITRGECYNFARYLGNKVFIVE
ncbi:MAG: hypothetical protein LBH44_05240 [Treponema sp.]|nr:hypothetical protein [Treponema sp.]